MAVSPSIFRLVNAEILEDIKDELRLQGHVAFGNLERSLRADEIFENGIIILEASSLGYIDELERGVPAAAINVKDFQKLERWVKLRGMQKNHTARQVAGYIVNKWRKEGMPTDSSFKYSQTGQRLHAVDISLDVWRDKYDRMLTDTISNEFDNHFKFFVKSATI